MAIEEALKERVSGTADSTRGIGLSGVVEDMRQPGRQLIIHSGIGKLSISEDMTSEAQQDKAVSWYVGLRVHSNIGGYANVNYCCL